MKAYNDKSHVQVYNMQNKLGIRSTELREAKYAAEK